MLGKVLVCTFNFKHCLIAILVPIGGQRGGGPLIMTHHHFSKTDCSNDDVILINTYGHQTPPLSTYVYTVCTLLYVVLETLFHQEIFRVFQFQHGKTRSVGYMLTIEY